MVGVYKRHARRYILPILVSSALAITLTPTNDGLLLGRSALDTSSSLGLPLTVVNSSYVGGVGASGTFTDGPQAFGSGTLLTTGAATDSDPHNPNPGPGEDNEAAGSALCTTTLGSAATYNAAVLDMYIDVPAGWDGITGRFMFASAEYPK
jgi:hypothetical protein